MPVIGFLDSTSPDTYADRLRGFRQGLKDTGYIEGETVAIEYRWAENQIDRLPELAAELVRRQIAVIVAGAPPSTFAAKAATTTIPIVFGVGVEPVQAGLVASLARPGSNLTGINFFSTELAGKRLELLRELVPAAIRVAVLVNPANAAIAESTLRDVKPLLVPWGCKSTCSTPIAAARSMRPTPLLCASAPTPSSLVPAPFSPADVSNWPSSQRAMRFQRSMRCVTMRKPAGLLAMGPA